MAPYPNKESKLFIEFIQSFDDEYLQPLSKISENYIGPLVDSEREMYDFDEICQNTKSFIEIENYSRTTDAFFYKIKNNGELKLYFIEFKGDYLDNSTRKRDMEDFIGSFKECIKKLPSKEQVSNYKDLFDENQIKIYGNHFSNDQLETIEDIYNKFSDSLLESLKLKPLESLLVALPVIYNDYIDKYGYEKKIDNMKNFLENCEKEVWVIGLSDNRSRTRLESNMSDSYKEKLEKQYDRLKIAKVFDDYIIEDQYYCVSRFVREFDS